MFALPLLKLSLDGLRISTSVASLVIQGYGILSLVRAGTRHMARVSQLLQAQNDVDDLTTIVVSGHDYEIEYRDCVQGEQHDAVVLEDVDEGDGVEGVTFEDGSVETPAAGRGPVSRRLARKKVVHKVYEGQSCVVHKPFIGDVVAQARNVYNSGPSDCYHRQLARAFMVRLMSAAGMRPAHINYHIDEMVVAVFLKTDRQLAADRMWRSAEWLGRIGSGPK